MKMIIMKLMKWIMINDNGNDNINNDNNNEK